MNRPVVSVVMGVRNCESFVEAAVRSALAQTFAEFEIIVVDDGSTDATPRVLGRVHDARLTFIAAEHRGSAAARNTAIGLANGAYLAFLDGDDLWDRGHLAEHVAALATNSDVAMTFSLSRIIDADGHHVPLPVRRVRGRFGFESLLRDNVIGNGSAVVARRSALPEGGFNESLKSCIDYELWLRFALANRNGVLCVPSVLTSYRRREGQVSGDWRRMKAGWEKMTKSVVPLAGNVSDETMRSAESNWYRYLAFVAYERGEEKEALSLLSHSFRVNPAAALINSKTWLLGGAILSSVILPEATHRVVENGVKVFRQAVASTFSTAPSR